MIKVLRINLMFYFENTFTIQIILYSFTHSCGASADYVHLLPKGLAKNGGLFKVIK